MARLNWSIEGTLPYTSGVARGVFYPKNGIGYAWNGLISVSETTVDDSQSLLYIDGVGHQNQLKLGSFAADISAVTYPDEFEPYAGYSGQRRNEFNFCYRTNLSDDNYEIHLVYNALATPTNRNHSSINSKIDLELFSWDLATRPEVIPDARSSSHFVIDTSQVYPGVIEELEAILYGDDVTQPTMPTVESLLALFEAHAILKITNHGDGTWTAQGPDDVVYMLDADTFIINWPSVVYLDEDTYHVSSL